MKTKLTILLLLFLPIIGLSAELSDKTVTYSNFSYVRDIAVSMQNVYFATTSGIIIYDKIDNSWLDPLTSSPDIDHHDIKSIWVDQFDKTLYAQTSVSLYEYDITLDNWFLIDERPPLDLQYQNINPLKIMYPPDGFNYVADGYLIDREGREFQMSRTTKDNDGQLWLGYWGYGAATSPNMSGSIELLPFGLLQNRIDAIHNDNGLLWLGGRYTGNYRNGITLFDPDKNQFSYLETDAIQNFPTGDINCFESDSDYVYTGTDAGLLILDKATNTVKRRISTLQGLPDDEITCLKLNGQKLYIGTINGMAFLDFENNELTLVKPREFVNSSIYDFETTDSTLWIGSSRGAYRLFLNDNRLQKFHDPKMTIFSNVQKIERYKDKLWLAADDGLVMLNLKTGKTRSFPSVAHGYDIRDISATKDLIALTSQRGVLFLSNFDNKHFDTYEISEADGLPGGTINSLLFDGDFIWIGSTYGLTRYFWNGRGRIN